MKVCLTNYELTSKLLASSWMLCLNSTRYFAAGFAEIEFRFVLAASFFFNISLQSAPNELLENFLDQLHDAVKTFSTTHFKIVNSYCVLLVLP